MRLAPGEEFKTAFLTHRGHFQFTVLAMGLTGGPNTFQGAMNTSLFLVNRKNTLVFFDDILVFSKTYKEHILHVRQVLSILQTGKWHVKLSKCAFA